MIKYLSGHPELNFGTNAEHSGRKTGLIGERKVVMAGRKLVV